MKTESSAVSGSDNPEPVDFEIAVPGQYPEDYEDSSPEWKAAYDHAAKHKNTPKASILWADAHAQDEGVMTEDSDELKARIAELEEQAEAKDTALAESEQQKEEVAKKLEGTEQALTAEQQARKDADQRAKDAEKATKKTGTKDK